MNRRRSRLHLLAAFAFLSLAAAPTPTPSTLMQAVTQGDVAAARRLLDAGADVNERGDDDHTPLMAAVKQSNTPLVELLLAHGADINAPDDRGVTPLRAAIEIPDTELAALLAARGAQLDAGGDERETQEPDIDVRGFDAWVPRPALEAPLRTGALGLAIDAATGKLYWTEHELDRIRRANADGSDIETLVNVAGPVGVAVDSAAGRIYWTTDRPYPRRIQSARLDGSDVREVLSGRFLNRPTDLLVNNVASHHLIPSPSPLPEGEASDFPPTSEERLYWAETVAGRIRRARLDGSGIEDIVDSGLGVEDRPGSEVTAAHGIALDATRRALYWTELTHGLIQRVGLKDGEEKTLLDRSGGLGSPAGIAVDAVEKKLYWADQATAKIQRADLDGGNVTDLVTRQQGLVRPRAVALDLKRRKLYWTDMAADVIQRADLDGGNVETVVRLGAKLDPCEDAPTPENVNRLLAPVEVCLDTVGAVKAVKSSAAEVEAAAELCARQLLRLDGVSAEIRAGHKVRCGEALSSPGALPSAANFHLARRYARAREWLEEVRPFIAALPPERLKPARVKDALAALDLLETTLRNLPLSRQSPGRAGLPASGQVSSYRALTAAVEPGFHIVADDGAVRAGGALRYIDNGDGTVTDRNTGLMWEKKCDCPGDLHHYHREYRWSDTEAATIWDWLDAVNAENGTGFAGYSDWRIPNVKELHSIVDYERFNPAVGAAFDAAACGLECKDIKAAACSCTENNSYWSSTTFVQETETAFAVGFNIGLIGEISKQDGLPVRAVRGPAMGAKAQ